MAYREPDASEYDIGDNFVMLVVMENSGIVLFEGEHRAEDEVFKGLLLATTEMVTQALGSMNGCSEA